MKTPLSIILLLALLQATPSFSQELRKPVVVSIQKMKGFSKDLNREVIVDSINAWLGNELPILFTRGEDPSEIDFVVEIYANWEIDRNLRMHSYGNSSLVYSGTTGSRDVDMESSGWTQKPQYSSPVTYLYSSSEEAPASGSFRVVIMDQRNANRKLGEYRIGVKGSTRTIDQMTVSSIRDYLVTFFCLN